MCSWSVTETSMGKNARKVSSGSSAGSGEQSRSDMVRLEALSDGVIIYRVNDSSAAMTDCCRCEEGARQRLNSAPTRRHGAMRRRYGDAGSPQIDCRI